MKIGIFGTGAVARTLGGALIGKGHAVRFGTRNVGQTLARAEKDSMGNVPFNEWQAAHPGAELVTFADAAAHGEVLINATSGMGSLSALNLAGPQVLAGKVLIDVSNPLDFSKGFPPSLSVCNTDSLGEQIQRALPDTKVVKTLNTMTAAIMVEPGKVPGEHNVFLSGNDGGAKKEVAGYLADWFGWKPENIIDVGDISTARGTEMLLPLWVRLYGVYGNAMFNWNIARSG